MKFSTAARAEGLRIEKDPEHQPHFTHQPGRIWLETNCYFDLWIETLNLLGLDPVPTFASVLAADHDGLQWTFIKQQPEDLRRLYGLETAEENVWMSVLETVESGPARGILHTVEVDSWWLPDTAGTAYRTKHEKTTIVPIHFDRHSRLMSYVHNAGLYSLSDDDFDGVFGLAPGSEFRLTPYIEQIRHRPDLVEAGALNTLTREYLARRAGGNPVERLAQGVRAAMEWLPSEGLDAFHPWAFATLRQCGATAELAADFVTLIDGDFTGANAAAAPFRTVAESAKSLQFIMARAAAGRRVDIEPALDSMIQSWQQAMDLLIASVE